MEQQQLSSGVVVRASAVRAAAGAVEAIDFRQLYLEEKRKARAAARKRNQQSDNEKVEPAVKQYPTELSETEKKVEDGAADPVPRLPPWNKLMGAPSFDYLPRLDRSSNSCRLSPIGIYYQRDFLAAECYRDYRNALLEWLSQLPINNDNHTTSTSSSIEQEERNAVGKWTELPHARRRVALFDSTFTAFPPPLQWLVDALVACGVFDNDDSTSALLPNHILINEYTTAAQGILPHTDGPAYAPRTATLSLSRKRGSSGSSSGVLLHFDPMVPNDDNDDDTTSYTTKKHQQHHQEVLLHNGGSLVVFEGAAYSDYRHSIAELRDDVECASGDCLNAAAGTVVERDDARISITVRHKFQYNNNNHSSQSK